VGALVPLEHAGGLLKIQRAVSAFWLSNRKRGDRFSLLLLNPVDALQ